MGAERVGYVVYGEKRLDGGDVRGNGVGDFKH